jgi:hypothetical protein
MLLLSLSFVAAPAFAEDPAAAPVPASAAVPSDVPQAAAAAPAAAAEAASKPAPAASNHKRPTAEEHFAQANLAHDGHLTLEEAKGGYRSIVRHFQDIDIDHKGYVTLDDIKAWRAVQRAARDARQTDNPLRPRSAFQQHTSAAMQRPIETGTTQIIPLPAPSPPEARAVPGTQP